MYLSVPIDYVNILPTSQSMIMAVALSRQLARSVIFALLMLLIEYLTPQSFVGPLYQPDQSKNSTIDPFQLVNVYILQAKKLILVILASY